MRDPQNQSVGNGNVLSSCSVLVTRPREQAETLCQLIEASGGKAIRFPVIEITRLTKTTELPNFDMAIFISANAVRYALQLYPQLAQLSPEIKIAAIGKATAAALKHFNIKVDLFPEAMFNSESLLSMPQLENIEGNTIALFKGEGGRGLLAKTLTRRGATVHELDVYRRDMPTIQSDDLIGVWSKNHVDVVIVTSEEGLNNLDKMLGEKGKELLRQTPLVVISERLQARSRQLGIKTVITAKQASDEAIVSALVDLRKK